MHESARRRHREPAAAIQPANLVACFLPPSALVSCIRCARSWWKVVKEAPHIQLISVLVSVAHAHLGYTLCFSQPFRGSLFGTGCTAFRLARKIAPPVKMQFALTALVLGSALAAVPENYEPVPGTSACSSSPALNVSEALGPRAEARRRTIAYLHRVNVLGA